MRRACWVAALLMVVVHCESSALPAPTPQRPLVMCAISCPAGWMFRPQHMCRNGQRWFQQIIVKGEHTTRGADGEKLTDVWITDQGDYAKEDVERGSCDSVIQGIVLARPADQRGVHPGEPDPLHPEHR